MLSELMGQLHFLRPYWLFSLLPLIGLGYYYWSANNKNNQWANVIDEHLLKHLLVSQKQVQKSSISYYWLFILGLILSIVAMAGPTFQKRPLPVFETELSKVVILDLSLSMQATDLEPNRLTRAKYKINDILESTKEGQIALIVYAGDAFTISPLTTDAKTIATLVPPLSPALMPVFGSQPAKAFELANELLTNAGVYSGQIIWITDGVDDNDYVDTKELLVTSPHQVSILAVGTADGAPIPLPDNQGFLKDSVTGQIVIPSLNYSVLEDLAKAAGGFISPLSAGDEDIRYLMSQLKNPQEFIATEDDLQMDTWIEFGPWLLLPALLIASLAFRKGLVFGLLFLIIPMVKPTTVSAQVNEQSTEVVNQAPPSTGTQIWQDLWLTPNQQAQQAFNKQQHNKAAQLFQDASWKSASLYRSGQYQAAIDANRAEDTTSLYNRANALAKAGQFEPAIQTYTQVLEMQPNHEDAEFNKKLVEDLLKQQQEQEQEQEQQDSDDQQQSQQQQDQQQSDQQQEQQEQDQQQQQQDQQSEQQQQEQQEQELKELEQMSEEEKKQVLEQWLRQIKDDPGGLLRRKMYMEYQRRQKQNKQLQEKGEKVW